MSMNKLRGLVMFAALGFGALTGCGGVEDAAAPEMDSVEQGLKYCQDNSQCPSGQGCINSACRPVADDAIPCGKWDPATGSFPSTTYCNSSQICCLNTGTCANSSAGCGI
ncbi:hypothetical protein [Corallococcus aberystwythensis]|uniref:Dickkopf N-terminal cysteine-rich domain-containing protein n=1 Tax=Corallococcus aberystwythensis TaxID=2316722 RepID=A0A3A8QB22_9BACT|nr:hypothetical protein [Corallococcus aberystwythensis]RKH61942.1 hypothetical protein D7W81_22980 [Corallococcus aberystwythensis]